VSGVSEYGYLGSRRGEWHVASVPVEKAFGFGYYGDIVCKESKKVRWSYHCMIVPEGDQICDLCIAAETQAQAATR